MLRIPLLLPPTWIAFTTFIPLLPPSNTTNTNTNKHEQKPKVKDDVANAMLTLINAERDGAVVDRGLLKACVQLFEAMGMGSLDAYTLDFEDKLLASTQEYYARKSSEWIDSDGTPAYMVKVNVYISVCGEKREGLKRKKQDLREKGACALLRVGDKCTLTEVKPNFLHLCGLSLGLQQTCLCPCRCHIGGSGPGVGAAARGELPQQRLGRAAHWGGGD